MTITNMPYTDKASVTANISVCRAFFVNFAASLICSSCHHNQLDSVASSVHDVCSCWVKLSMTACLVDHTMRCWTQACCQSLQRARPLPLVISMGSRSAAVRANATIMYYAHELSCIHYNVSATRMLTQFCCRLKQKK